MKVPGPFTQSSSDDPDHIGFNVSSMVGFGRGYTLDQWERLMAGERLFFTPMPGDVYSYVGVVYEVRREVLIGRNATSERLTRNSDQFTWTLNFGEATDSLGSVLTEEDQSVTLTVVFTPDVQCTGCIPGSEIEGGGCLGQHDPMLQSDYCRAAIERFRLVEYGFVDPALLE